MNTHRGGQMKKLPSCVNGVRRGHFVLTEQLVDLLAPEMKRRFRRFGVDWSPDGDNRVHSNPGDVGPLEDVYTDIAWRLGTQPSSIARLLYRIFRKESLTTELNNAEVLLEAFDRELYEVHVLPAGLPSAAESVNAWAETWGVHLNGTRDALVDELKTTAIRLVYTDERPIVVSPELLHITGGGESHWLRPSNTSRAQTRTGASSTSTCPTNGTPDPNGSWLDSLLDDLLPATKSGAGSSTSTVASRPSSRRNGSPCTGTSATTSGGSQSKAGTSRPTGSKAK
jgi:hypothetical protein